jgi:hypothetical protein
MPVVYLPPDLTTPPPSPFNDITSNTQNDNKNKGNKNQSQIQAPRGDNTAATLQGILHGFGIPPGFFSDLIDQAVRNNWTTDELLAAIYGSPQFAQMFPGIFRPDGSLRMPPGEYRQLIDMYRSQARLYGYTDLTDAQIGQLIAGDVSVQEFTDRLEAVRRISEFKPAFEEFKQVLRARGISTAGLESDKDLVRFMLGQAPKQFYQIWEETAVGTAARMAGVKMGAKAQQHIARLTPGISSEAELQRQMQELARHIRTTLPLSKIQKMGLTKKDLITLEFGGPNQAKIFEKAQRILATQQAFAEREPTGVALPQVGKIQQQRAQSA